LSVITELISGKDDWSLFLSYFCISYLVTLPNIRNVNGVYCASKERYDSLHAPFLVFLVCFFFYSFFLT
jgi:hypothetical protein